jgi:hypothetical protein
MPHSNTAVRIRRKTQPAGVLPRLPQLLALASAAVLVAPVSLAGASPFRLRSPAAVEQFASHTAQHFLRTYAGEGGGSPVARCARPQNEIWRCRVSTDGGECVVNLSILDEGPGGPPLYVLNQRARCDE